MKDKVYFAASPMFCLVHPEDKFCIYDEGLKSWELNVPRYFNLQHRFANAGVNLERWVGWNCWKRWRVDGAWHYGPIESERSLTPFLVDPSSKKFQLDQRNPKYWGIMDRGVGIANYPSQKEGNPAPGITIWVDLAYQYQGDPGDIGGSPWRNNTLGITSLYDPAAWPYFEAYALEWFALKKQGRKIEFGMGNEGDIYSLEFYGRLLRLMDRERIWPFSYGICAEIPSPDGNDLFKALGKIIQDENLFAWHPLRQVQPEKDRRWDTSIIRIVHGASKILMNGLSVFKQAFLYWAFLPIRWFISDDGDMGPEGKPKAVWWIEVIKLICSERAGAALTIPWGNMDGPANGFPLIGIEHLPDDEPWDECENEQLGILEAMGKEYAKYFPPLENAGQWPDDWVEPVIVVPPGPGLVIDVPTIKPPFNWKGFWRNRWGWIKNHRRYIALAVLIGLLLVIVVC